MSKLKGRNQTRICSICISCFSNWKNQLFFLVKFQEKITYFVSILRQFLLEIIRIVLQEYSLIAPCTQNTIIGIPYDIKNIEEASSGVLNVHTAHILPSTSQSKV